MMFTFDQFLTGPLPHTNDWRTPCQHDEARQALSIFFTKGNMNESPIESTTIKSYPWERPFWKPTKGKGAIFFYLIAIHVLAVTGLILFPLPSLRVAALTVIFAWLGGLGTTVCYHRALSHRTVKLNKIVEQALIFCAMFNGSGAPASWVAYHR